MIKGIFDSHAHYDDVQFDSDRDEILSSLPSQGISGIINCGTSVKSSEFSLELSRKYPYIYAACGIHPEDVENMKGDALERIEVMLSDPKCVALGEIGLDYHYGDSTRELQKVIFERQLEIALKHELPVIIHDRESHADIMEMIIKHRPKGVLHCFSGSREMAAQAVKLGMYIGIGGAVTFKNAVKPVEVAASIPLERMLLETDCPYMSPVPMRGKRNISVNIAFVAEKIAEIRGCNPQEIVDQTRKNAMELFGI